MKVHYFLYQLLVARPAFSGPLASQGVAPVPLKLLRTPDKIADFSNRLLDLIAEFDRRFTDFHDFNTYDFSIFNDLIKFDVDKEATYLEMELIDLQCDTALKSKFKEFDILVFYSYLTVQ